MKFLIDMKLRTARPRVIQVRTQDVLPSAIGDLVLWAIQTTEANLPFRQRVRMLPI
jgi:predicted nuclease of predicted toxin-antitoxin system